MMTSSMCWRIFGSLALAGLLLSGASTDAQARPRSKDRAARPVNAQIWMDAYHYTAGQQVRFSVTVDQPGFVSVFRVDAHGRRHRLTADPAGVWVTPRRVLRAPGPEFLALYAPDMCGPERLVVVAQNRAFRSASEYFSLAFAPSGFHGSCGVSSCTFDVVRGPVRRVPVGVTWGVRVGDVELHLGPRARVYVDGLFCGLGPAALNLMEPGPHRVTVVTESGRKFSHSVHVPHQPTRCKPLRADGRRGRYHP